MSTTPPGPSTKFDPAEPMVPVVRATTSPAAGPPTAAPGSHAGGSHAGPPTGSGSGGKFIAAIVVLCVLGGIGWAIFKALEPDVFEVGDCVEVVERTIDQDLKSATCPGIYDADPYSNIYVVVDVLDGANRTCPYLAGGAEFSHEPHDKTYCLAVPNTDY
ncbi:MAG: hypothetical protein KF906_05495 [Actinobacteria bacterium]|nr:hypothetical protein [Actinomycetota bacterium]